MLYRSVYMYILAPCSMSCSFRDFHPLGGLTAGEHKASLGLDLWYYHFLVHLPSPLSALLNLRSVRRDYFSQCRLGNCCFLHVGFFLPIQPPDFIIVPSFIFPFLARLPTALWLSKRAHEARRVSAFTVAALALLTWWTALLWRRRPLLVGLRRTPSAVTVWSWRWAAGKGAPGAVSDGLAYAW